MIWILLLLFFTSCVCGTFIVNVKQISYQAEENGNVTMEWIFPPKPNMSLSSLSILCALVSPTEEKTLYYLENGVEDPQSQHEQFAGRVRCDEHRLREGTIRLHLSRLRTNDSGTYLCEVFTGYGENFSACSLNVTVTELDPEQRELGRFLLIRVGAAALVALAAVAALAAVVSFACQHSFPNEQQGQGQEKNINTEFLTDQTKNQELVSAKQRLMNQELRRDSSVDVSLPKSHESDTECTS
ncbi:uncharacterized protein [Centroberyx affinis]|uniref:uncharacterized protein n=1 Tax=Centroberyx affinis TaxID=166261 RepID=UPI003A5C0527